MRGCVRCGSVKESLERPIGGKSSEVRRLRDSRCIEVRRLGDNRCFEVVWMRRNVLIILGGIDGRLSGRKERMGVIGWIIITERTAVSGRMIEIVRR